MWHERGRGGGREKEGSSVPLTHIFVKSNLVKINQCPPLPPCHVIFSVASPTSHCEVWSQEADKVKIILLNNIKQKLVVNQQAFRWEQTPEEFILYSSLTKLIKHKLSTMWRSDLQTPHYAQQSPNWLLLATMSWKVREKRESFSGVFIAN